MVCLARDVSQCTGFLSRSLLTGNVRGSLGLMKDFHEVDRIEERMVLNVFAPVGHTAQPCGHVNDQNLLDQIGQVRREC